MINTVSLSIIPEFTSVNPARGVVWMTGGNSSFSNPAAVEIKESNDKIIRTVNLNHFSDAQTIDPVTGNLIEGTVDGYVALVNEATGAEADIPVANEANSFAGGIGVDTVTGNIYVADRNVSNAADHDSTVSEISQQTDSVIDSIDVPNQAEAVAVDSATGTVYVAPIVQSASPLVLAGSVLVIKESTNKIVDTIGNVGNLPYSMTVDPISGKLFVSHYFAGSLVVINLKTNKITDTIVLPKGFAADTPAADPVNGMVHVNDFDEGAEFVVSEQTDALVATIKVPDAAGGLAVDPARALVYAGSESPGSGSLAVIQAAPPSL